MLAPKWTILPVRGYGRRLRSLCFSGLITDDCRRPSAVAVAVAVAVHPYP
ncbi:hypothetical protein ACQEVB_35935 [Pseudonocardia sp. CA-107938]